MKQIHPSISPKNSILSYVKFPPFAIHKSWIFISYFLLIVFIESIPLLQIYILKFTFLIAFLSHCWQNGMVSLVLSFNIFPAKQFCMMIETEFSMTGERGVWNGCAWWLQTEVSGAKIKEELPVHCVQNRRAASCRR